MKKRNKILVIEFFILIFILGFVSSENIIFDSPNEANINEEFEINLKIINFSEDIYDVKIDIFCEEDRISKIFDGKWKSTNYYVNDIIQNNEEREFKLKIEKECEEANIVIKIKNSKNKFEVFTGYKIRCVEEEIKKDEEENFDEGKKEVKEEIEENEEELGEEDYENEFSHEEKVENVSLKPIILNTKNIKSENDKEFSTKNLALCGVIFFCVIFGALFFLNKRKYKNEFQ
jgi:hypothetical protein